ncbi:chymotrypsin inhibitor-like isoform X2 [Ptiloglossa arizonensis]|uniref:chymotrypsin inhibitor-like isoform X2 n=1 Tax=Ptiloglossa arizonensis TaxID=3350558 RepID=UPI003FA0A4E5
MGNKSCTFAQEVKPRREFFITRFTGNVLRAAHTVNMSHRLLILFAILAIFAATDASQRCPRNEIWNECGSACPPTCKNPKPQICIDLCVPGCTCKRGFLRNNAGKCVPPSAC